MTSDPGDQHSTAMRDTWPHKTLGNSNNPPIIFLHGFMGRGTDWAAVAQHFKKSFFCVLPDLPGHGENTQLDPGKPVTFATLNTGLHSLLGAHDVKTTTLIGYSLGGRIALNFACENPQSVNQLVLESTSPGITDPQARLERAALDEARAIKLRTIGICSFVQNWYQAELWASLRNHPEKFEKIISKRNQNDPDWMAKLITELSPGRMKSRWDCLPRLHIPTLLIAGELDIKYAAITPQAGTLIPASQTEIIRDAGHNTHLEQPDSFTNLALEFLMRSIKN